MISTSVRIQKLRNRVKEKHADGMVITNPKNILYLSGFRGISPNERESCMLITQKDCFLFIPAMYELQAQGLDSITLIVDHERHGLLSSFQKYIKEQQIILIEGNNVTLTEFEKMQQGCKAKLIPEKYLIESLRKEKDEQEIMSIQKACEITDMAFQKTVEFLQQTHYESLTENDVAEFLRTTGRNLGADGFGFEPIVASGSGSAEPHYFTSKKKLQKNAPLLLDFGFSFHGYTADLSRTFFLGQATEEHKNIYALVKECQQLCMDSWEYGMSGKDLHMISLNFFQKAGVEKQYLHSLGHGVGLDVHEQPGIGLHSEQPLLEHMVFTIEPGLYFANNFGVRIEDVVLVKDKKLVVLSNKSEKHFIQI